MNPRFKTLSQAFYRLIGRSEASRRAGHYRRAYIQVLAANRIYKLLLQ